MSLSMTRLPQRNVVTGMFRSKSGTGNRPSSGLAIQTPMLPSSIRSITSFMCEAVVAITISASIDVPRQRQSATFDDPSSTTALAVPAVNRVASAAAAVEAISNRAMKHGARIGSSVLRGFYCPAERDLHVVARLDGAHHRGG